jgi:hypothetical protein
LLFVFTIIVVLFSNYLVDENYYREVIIIISILKFLAISFYFMELKKAHVFWKASIFIYLLFFASIIVFY